MRFALFATLILISGFAEAKPQSSIVQPRILGQGLTPCEDWLKARNIGGNEFRLLESWFFGYLTGFQFGGKTIKYELSKWTTDRLFSEMDKNCREKPLQSISDAATLVGFVLSIGNIFESNRSDKVLKDNIDKKN